MAAPIPPLRRNLAENFAFVLFVFGQLLAFDLLFLLPLSYFVSEGVFGSILFAGWLGYRTFAATAYHWSTWYATLAKMVFSLFLWFLIVMLGFGIYEAAASTVMPAPG